MTVLRVYGDIESGNCYKVKLLLALLGREHDWIGIDTLAGDTRTPAYLSKNPNGKIPLLELEDGRLLSESNAILNFLANGSDYLPVDPYQRAKVLQWQFFEQYSHEPYIAVARFIAKYQGLPDERRAEYELKQDGGHKALRVLEETLARSPYLAGGRYTIADISLYAYTHVAHEGGFDLGSYPALIAWIERIASHPRHVTIEQFLVDEDQGQQQ